MAPRKYIEKICDSSERIFGHPTKTNVSSPIEKNDHPVIDTLELLDLNWIQKYQSYIDAFQWVLSIDRFNVNIVVMTIYSFRVPPRRGHLEHMKRIYGYLSKMKHGIIRIRVQEPDFSHVPVPEYDWEKSVYGPIDALKP